MAILAYCATPLFPPDLQCHRAQMPAAVLCQGLAVSGTFPNLLAEFAPAHTPFSKALFPTYFERVVQKKVQTSPPSPSSFASIWYLSLVFLQ